MPDEIQPPVGDTPQPPPATSAPEPQPSGADDSGEGDTQPKVFDEAYVKELRKESAKHRTEARELQKALEELRSEKKTAEEKKLAEQNDWKTLAEQRAGELAQLKADLEAERLNGLKSRIGTEFKLTPRLIERLQGKTEEELRADAAAISSELGLDKPATDQSAQAQNTPARSQPATTTAVPGGQPVTRTDTDRHRDYFGGANTSPIFQAGKLIVNGKGDLGET